MVVRAGLSFSAWLSPESVLGHKMSWLNLVRQWPRRGIIDSLLGFRILQWHFVAFHLMSDRLSLSALMGKWESKFEIVVLVPLVFVGPSLRCEMPFYVGIFRKTRSRCLYYSATSTRYPCLICHAAPGRAETVSSSKWNWPCFHSFLTSIFVCVYSFKSLHI